jgi:hypothetical protein
MEFLDTLIRLFSGCVGLLEVLTIFLDIAAVYFGVKTYQKYKHAAEKLAHHTKAPVKKPTWWPIVVLAILALAFTALTSWKWRNILGVH